MGQRGPKPTPTKILKLHGSRRAGKNKNEPKPTIAAPICPSHLIADAKAEWKRIVPELKKLGLLTKIDRAALAGYCQSWGRWVNAEKKIQKIGEVVKSPSGYPIQNPWLSIANKALKQCESFIKEFGLSPSARTRISVELPQDEKDALENLLLRRTVNE